MPPTRPRRYIVPSKQLGQSSHYRGVTFHRSTQKFRANIKIKGKKLALGAFLDEVEAAKAFDRAAVRYRGARAEVNFPAESKAEAEPGSKRAPKAARTEAEPACGKGMTSTKRALEGPVISLPVRQSKRRTVEEQAIEELDFYGEDFMGALDDSMMADELPDVPTDLLMEDDSTELPRSRSCVPAMENLKEGSPSCDNSVQAEGEHFTGFTVQDAAEQCTKLDMNIQVRNHSYNDSEDSGHSGTPMSSVTRQPSVHSQGLGMLQSRGFGAHYAHDNPQVPHSKPTAASMQTCEPHFLEAGGNHHRSFQEYRDMLIQRSLMHAAEDETSDEEYSTETLWNCMPHLQPVTFGNPASLPSKNAWWRQQLRRAQADDMHEQMYMQLAHNRLYMGGRDLAGMAPLPSACMGAGIWNPHAQHQMQPY